MSQPEALMMDEILDAPKMGGGFDGGSSRARVVHSNQIAPEEVFRTFKNQPLRDPITVPDARRRSPGNFPRLQRARRTV
jgi:hypothetical protein